MQPVGAFIVAFAVVLLSTPHVIRLAWKLDAVDKPEPRRVNKIPLPRLGGLAIVAAFWVGTLSFVALDRQVLGLVLGSAVIVAIGVIDDIKGLSPWVKLAVQAAAALTTIHYGYQIEWIRNPLGSGYLYLEDWSIPITLLWIVGVTNALNFIDGLDGLAAGVTAISSLTLLVVAMYQGFASVVVMMAALAGSTLAFLRFNFNPARIIMGDSGALFLGFVLANLSIVGVMKSATTIALVVPVMALGLPLTDTALAVMRRLRNGKSPFYADRGHLHHRLLDDYGCSQRQAVSILYGFSLILGIAAIALTSLPYRQALLICASLFVVALVSLWVILRALKTSSAKQIDA